MAWHSVSPDAQVTNSLIKEMDLGSEQGHYCDYPHPLTTQLTISQHDAPCPAPGRLGGCGRQWPRESVTFEANQNCSRLFPSVEKIFSQRGKLVGNYVSCCGPADGTVTASRSPRVSPAFLATESRHMEQTGLKMSRLLLLSW